MAAPELPTSTASTRCQLHHCAVTSCPAPDLTPLGKVTRFEAESADGIWTYLCDAEFPAAWHVEHNPTGKCLMFAAPTLESARAGTADGAFDTLLGLNVAVAA